MSIFEAYRRATISQLQPAMLLLAIGPVVVAALFWAGVLWWKWSTLLVALDTLFKALPVLESVSDRLLLYGVKVIPFIFMAFAFAALFVPLTMITALGFISIVGMPLMARHVAARDYPDVERRHGGSFAGSLANSLQALFWFVLLVVPTFVLWFLPFVGLFIPLFLLGRLNARVLRYDALAEHASAEELRRLAAAPGLRWGWLGVMGALMNLIPFLWFFSTTITGLAFIHTALDALDTERAPSLIVE
jgi:uncharacterized protein involved in cysteine biosynthesis